jgi:hypothetical protein
MGEFVPVEHDPFETAPPRAALPPSSASDWAPVEHAPEFHEGKDTGAPPEEHRGFLDTVSQAARRFANDLHRSRAAASQGTTPILSAHKENLISEDVQEGDDGNLYYKDAEGRLQPADTNKHVALPGDDGKLRIYQRTADTDEGRISSAGRLMMTGMAAGTPRFGTELPAAGVRVLGIGTRGAPLPVHPGWVPSSSTGEAIEAAGRLGVDLPKAIASESKNVNFLGQVMAKAPGGAPLHTAIEEGLQGEEGLAGALKRTGAEAGGVADAKAAGTGVTTGLEDIFKPESQKVVRSFYDRLKTLVDPNKTAPLTEVQKTVGDILARKQAYGNEKLGGAVDAVAGALQRPGGLTYEAMQDLRTSVRELQKKGERGLLPPTMSEGELNDIYGALTRDLGNAAEITGGPRGRAAWEVANRASRLRKEALDTLNKVVGPKSRSDEGVMDALHRMAGTGAGADVDTLSTVRQALTGIPGAVKGAPGAWENVASTVISRLGKNSQGEFSPNLFIRDYNDLSPAGRRMLFSGVGHGNVVNALDDIARVSDKYVKAGKLANTSGSAGHGALIGAIATGATRLASGDVLTPIGIAAGVLGANMTSRLLGAPATAASVARWTRAVDSLAQTPGLRTWAAYNVASRNLGNTTAAVTGNPSLAPHLINKLQGAVHRPDERQDQ